MRKKRVGSMDGLEDKMTGQPLVSWENLWFLVDVPLNRLIGGKYV